MRPRFFLICFALLCFTSMMVFSSIAPVFATSFTHVNTLKDNVSDSAHTSVTATTQSQTDLPSPSWWSGICDTNNYFAATGVSAYTLPQGASTSTTYRGVLAGGPRPYTDG